ncbi:MAG TPA: hypothetical protein VH107_20015 [Lacipirellulaceae bacterium]|jgi:hypothetical protein|nr:hypothetical protein [Lacipirellulaceae bacterium]
MTSTPVTFWEWFTTLDTGDLAGLSILAVLGGVSVIIVLSSVVYLMHKNRLQDSLKRELLDRGFSAEEIALVVYGTGRKAVNESKISESLRETQAKQS